MFSQTHQVHVQTPGSCWVIGVVQKHISPPYTVITCYNLRMNISLLTVQSIYYLTYILKTSLSWKVLQWAKLHHSMLYITGQPELWFCFVLFCLFCSCFVLFMVEMSIWLQLLWNFSRLTSLQPYNIEN